MAKYMGALVVLLILQEYVCWKNTIDQYLGRRFEYVPRKEYSFLKHFLGKEFLNNVRTLLNKPVMSLSKNGTHYQLTSESSYPTEVITFTPGEPFEYTTIDGRNVQAVITIMGNTLHEVQVDQDGSKRIINRTLGANGMKIVQYAAPLKRKPQYNYLLKL